MKYPGGWGTLIALGLYSVVYGYLQHPPDEVLTFLLLGDWGKGGTTGTYGQRKLMSGEDAQDVDLVSANDHGKEPLKQKKVLRQMQVATAMGKYSAETNPKPSFLIALGDNFYDNGVYSSTDSLWQYLWKDVYLQFDDLNIPWYPVFGNHDYGYGNTGVQAQITRYKEHTDDDIWIFPDTNYTRRFDIPGPAGGSVVVVFIDTTTLAPSVNRCCNENGGVSQEVQQARIINQLEHIDRMLNDTVADPPTWLLVAGHYPIYSASSNGDTDELVTNLLPLLQKYHVHAYICGHDHVAEHLQKEGYSTEFFVVGAGSMQDAVGYSSEASMVWGGPMYSSFASVNATVDDLTIVFRDYNGTVRYEYMLTNPNYVPVPPTVVPTASPTEFGAPDLTDAIVSRKRKSFLSWGFWSDQASNASTQDIAMASGGVAAMGLMVFLCYAAFKRRKHGKDEKIKERPHLSRTPNLMQSSRQGRASAFYSRKPYEELNDLEQGRGYEDLELSDDDELPVMKKSHSSKYLPLHDTTSPTASNSLETDTSEPDVNHAPQDPSPRAAASVMSTSREPAEATPATVNRSRANTLAGGGGVTHHSRTSTSTSTDSDSHYSAQQGSTHSTAHTTAHSSTNGSGEVATPVQDSSPSDAPGRSRASTMKGTEHSRTSSRSESGHSQSADLYSTNLSAEQMDIGTAWLFSHARSPSITMPAPPPPPPSPSLERSSVAQHLLANEVQNPLLLSPGTTDATTGAGTPSSTGRPPRRPFAPFHTRQLDSNTGGIGQESPENSGSGGPVPRSSPPKHPNMQQSGDEIRLAPLTLVKPHRRTTTSPM